ncbi:hypothetical protein V496_02369 [Pseudogymnoascus sp. VKM F-4515 (FW-2607)]|nr:hypothetical protein V496_02369 [Pseudogymnoascus sp. VKM F-4515 (FW-2607)]
MDHSKLGPVTPVRTRASISSSSLNKSEEEIVKKLHTHPERLSSGELAKTLLSTFNKNLGKFSLTRTFDVYLRWLEAQRRAPQSTINYNWKNVVLQWAQSLKARDVRLKDLVLEVEHWKRSHGPFYDTKTEVNPRYPPTIDELEIAYNMDLRPHSARNPPAQPVKKENRRLYEELRCGYRGPELNRQEVTKSPAKHYSSPPKQSSASAHKNSPGGTIGLFVMNVGNYTNNEVVEIFHPDSRSTVTRLESWLTNRTVHFKTLEDRDRAYHLLPDDLKARKEKDFTRPLVRIYCGRGNKQLWSDIDTNSGYTGSPEKIQRRPDGVKDIREEAGLYFMNTRRYSRKDVEKLFDERDVMNIVDVERLSKSNVLVRFPSMYLRDKALKHLPSYLKDDTETLHKTSLFVVLFNPNVHGVHPASRLRERQINGPDKFYGTRADKNESRIERSIAAAHGHVSRWNHTRDENDGFRLPDRTLSDEGRLSRYESANNSSPDFGRHKQQIPVFPPVQRKEGKENGYLNDEESMLWDQGRGDVFAGLWLEKLADEIMEQKSKLVNPTSHRNDPARYSYNEEEPTGKGTLQYAASVADETGSGNAKVGLKRPRTPDHIDHREYMGDSSKRAKRVNDSAGPMISFEGDLSDGDGLDCSTLGLTRVKRLNALQMWDLLDSARSHAESVESETSNSSENGAVVEENSDGYGDEEEADADVQRADKELETISSPDDGWCSSRDYWAGSSEGSNSSELEEGASGHVDTSGADTVEMGNSDVNLDADMACGSPRTPSE